jgi:hypothetical protein
MHFKLNKKLVRKLNRNLDKKYFTCEKFINSRNMR